MRRRHLKLLSLWVLPLLVLRALIPTGFMLSVNAGGLELTFCPAVIQPQDQPQALQALEHSSHHAGMHHADAGDDEAASYNDDDAPCPFSLVASAIPDDVPYIPGAGIEPSDERFDFVSSPTVRVGPVRADRIRGPPSIA